MDNTKPERLCLVKKIEKTAKPPLNMRNSNSRVMTEVPLLRRRSFPARLVYRTLPSVGIHILHTFTSYNIQTTNQEAHTKPAIVHIAAADEEESRCHLVLAEELVVVLLLPLLAAAVALADVDDNVAVLVDVVVKRVVLLAPSPSPSPSPVLVPVPVPVPVPVAVAEGAEAVGDDATRELWRVSVHPWPASVRG